MSEYKIRVYKKYSEEEKKDISKSKSKRVYEYNKNNSNYKEYQRKYQRDRYRRNKIAKMNKLLNNIVYEIVIEDND